MCWLHALSVTCNDIFQSRLSFSYLCNNANILFNCVLVIGIQNGSCVNLASYLNEKVTGVIICAWCSYLK